MRSTWLILLLGCCFHMAVGQELFLEVDQKTIRFGEPIAAQLEIKANAQTKAQGLRLVDSLDAFIAPLEFIQPYKVDTTATENAGGFEFVYQLQMQVSGYDSGRFELGPLPVLLGEDTLFSNSVFVDVMPVALDTSAAPKPIKENREVPVTALDYLAVYYPYPLSVIILAVLAYFIWKRWRKIKALRALAQKEKKPEEPVIPAHILAMEGLEKLQREKAWEHLEDKEFYSAITDITRKYVSARYGIRAMEQTSQEIVNSLQYKMQPKSLLTDLQETLNIADMAKFAKEKPGATFAKERLEQAILLVEKTAEKEETDA